MFNVFRKQSSSDKSASLGRNSSLRSTGTNPILDAKLKIKFQSFQDVLGTLKKHGDIVPLKEYQDLHKDIQKSELSDTDKNLLLFKICEDKADIAWQKREFSTHAQSLKEMFSIDVPSALIALEEWGVKYEKQNINKKANDCINNIRTLYIKSVSAIEEEVNSLLQNKKYGEAVKKLEYLTAHSNSFHIFAIHAKILIKQGDDLKADGNTPGAKEYYENAYQYCKSKLSKDEDVQYDVIHDTFKVLAGKFSVVGDTKLVAEAATCASKYKPNPVATASAAQAVNHMVRKAEKKLEKLTGQFEKVSNNLEKVKARAKQKAEADEFAARQKAEADEFAARQKAEAEALKLIKASPTQDTKVDGVGDSSIPSAPPPYSDIDSNPYLRLGKNAPIAPIAEVVPPLDSEVLTELIELAHLIPSLDWRDSNYDTTKGKAKRLLSEAINKNPYVYKTIEDSKILVLLADVLLSLKDMKVARIVCERALEIDPNIWEATNDQIVLLNLAGVLLPSNQLKAEQIYSKAINIRIYSKDEHGHCKIDSKMTTIVSKTVAQDQYSAEEKDCLAKVCLSSPKVFQKAQALDCYTDVNKRKDIAVQLKQLAKQEPQPRPGEYKGYMLYTKAFSVLKEDPALLQDMKAAYDATSLAVVQHASQSASFPYPPTEDSTAHLIGMCATTDC